MKKRQHPPALRPWVMSFGEVASGKAARFDLVVGRFGPSGGSAVMLGAELHEFPSIWQRRSRPLATVYHRLLRRRGLCASPRPEKYCAAIHRSGNVLRAGKCLRVERICWRNFKPARE